MTREQLMVMLCPAFLVLAGYNYWYFRPAYQKHTSAEKSFVAAQSKAPQDLHRLEHLRADEKSVQAAVSALQQKLAARQSDWQTLQQKRQLVDTQVTVERLGDLLRRQGLYVQEVTHVSTASVPPSLRQSLTQLAATPEPAAWEFRVIGRYSDVREVLAALARGDAGWAIPIGLTMEKASLEVTLRKWTLVVLL